ncbi:MAG: BTAD domain-containing putative transcriptional regulator [Planctomycetota bacterium]
MNRKRRRKQVVSPARPRIGIKIVAAAVAILLVGLVWIARTALGPRSQHPRDGLREVQSTVLIEKLIQRVAVGRAAHRTSDAIDAARQLADAAPNDPRWWRLLAGLYEEQDDVVHEIEAYRRALRHELPTADVMSLRHKLVDQLVFLGDASEARYEFDQLEAFVAAHVPPKQRRDEQTRLDVTNANLLRLEGQPQQALDSLNRALVTLDDAPLAIRLRGIILLDLGEVESAAADLERAARELPYDEVVHYKLSAAYRRLGRTNDADRHLEKYQQIHDASLEIQSITREVEERPLSDEQQQRLTQLYKEVGN